MLFTVGLLTAAPVPAVVILDSTWRDEGGGRGREADGFGAHIRLAREPQFRALVSVSYDDGSTWGDGSGTWIGNDGGHGYVLTSAHLLDEAKAGEILFRTDGGAVRRGSRSWIHPGYDPNEDRTGVDAAIIRLDGPVEDAGPAPVLYDGGAEKGKTVTFVGFGMRGIASIGEDDRFHKGSDKAAAQGVVEEAVPLRSLSAKVDEPGNYLTLFLPREDGGIENPHGGSRRPVSRLAGLLGAGDSGGSAWMPMGDGWVIVGINTSGDGNAQYGDNSWFVRVSGIRPWIASVFPGARFSGERGRGREREPAPATLTFADPSAAPSAAPSAECRERERFFVLSDGAWYPARVRGAGERSGGCEVRYDGYSSDEDEEVGRNRMIPWTDEGPGTALDGCRPGVAVVAEEDGVWYPATIAKALAKGCRVRYEDTEYDDETLPLARLRALR